MSPHAMTRALFLVALLAAVASPATAEPVTLQPDSGPVNFSVVFGRTHTTMGAFDDEYFIPFDGPALVNGQLIAVFQPAQSAMHAIRFTAVELDGLEMDLTSIKVQGQLPTVTVLAPHIAAIPTEGGFLLTVSGCAGGNCRNGDHQNRQADSVTASYSGTINIRKLQVQDVPEPTTLALLLAGLGGAALAKRRGETRRPLRP